MAYLHQEKGKSHYSHIHTNYESPTEGHRLPPKTLESVKPSSRRRKAIWIFILAFLGAALPPLSSFAVAYLFVVNLDEHSVYTLICWDKIHNEKLENWVAFGGYSFALVKTIDVVFNLVIGRGGQLIMGYITYKAHIAGLVQVMESSPVSYELFTAMSLTGTSGTTLLALARRIFSTWRYSPRMIWFLLSTSYVMSFSSLMGAMMRYQQDPDPVIVLQGGGYMPLGDFLSNTTLYYDGISSRTPGVTPVTSYQWISLPKNNRFNTAVFELNGTTYSSEYINSSCLDKGLNVTYNYGCMGTMLVVVCILQFIWTIGTYIVWICAHRGSELKKAGRQMGIYRAIIDAGGALAEDLGANTGAYSNRQLKKSITERKLCLTYYQTPDEPPHIGITSRRVNEKERVKILGAASDTP